MSVIVNNNMPIELALRLLWRESTREGVIEKLQERRYFVPDSFERHQKRRVLKKAKKRRRAAKRRSNSFK